MSLRAKLVAAFTGLLLLVIVALGAVLVSSTREVLTGQVDEQLRGVETRFRGSLFGRNQGGEFGQLPERGRDRGTLPFFPGAEEVALVVLDRSSNVVFDIPSGFSDDPDPLPDAARYFEEAEQGLTTIPSVDGSIRYRAIGESFPEGVRAVWAISLEEADAAAGRLLGTLIAAGVAVLVGGASLTWWTVRRGLRPVDEMVDTATAIAAGDLSQRVPAEEPSTELGRLGGALNDMLSQIEGSFETERQARDRLELFVADASHELRTPIAAISGYAELYRKGGLETPEALDTAMGRIARESGRMQRLVEDLMLLAHLDANRPVERRAVDLGAVVRDAVTDSRAIDPDRPLEFENRSRVVVSGDEQRLTQVLANLLANARAHTPPLTPVEVRMTTENKTVSVDVIDEGPGLDPGVLDKVFDRFYRVDTSRARSSGGTGLGLAIVAAIVDAHGGTVEAANQPERGARFTVTLPTR